MLIVITQNKALVNISNFESISVQQDDDDNTCLVCDGYVLGYYPQDESVYAVQWIAQNIANSNKDENVCIVMPQEIDLKEGGTEDAKND